MSTVTQTIYLILQLPVDSYLSINDIIHVNIETQSGIISQDAAIENIEYHTKITTFRGNDATGFLYPLKSKIKVSIVVELPISETNKILFTHNNYWYLVNSDISKPSFGMCMYTIKKTNRVYVYHPNHGFKTPNNLKGDIVRYIIKKVDNNNHIEFSTFKNNEIIDNIHVNDNVYLTLNNYKWSQQYLDKYFQLTDNAYKVTEVKKTMHPYNSTTESKNTYTFTIDTGNISNLDDDEIIGDTYSSTKDEYGYINSGNFKTDKFDYSNENIIEISNTKGFVGDLIYGKRNDGITEFRGKLQYAQVYTNYDGYDADNPTTAYVKIVTSGIGPRFDIRDILTTNVFINIVNKDDPTKIILKGTFPLAALKDKTSGAEIYNEDTFVFLAEITDDIISDYFTDQRDHDSIWLAAVLGIYTFDQDTGTQNLLNSYWTPGETTYFEFASNQKIKEYIDEGHQIQINIDIPEIDNTRTYRVYNIISKDEIMEEENYEDFFYKNFNYDIMVKTRNEIDIDDTSINDFFNPSPDSLELYESYFIIDSGLPIKSHTNEYNIQTQSNAYWTTTTISGISTEEINGKHNITIINDHLYYFTVSKTANNSVYFGNNTNIYVGEEQSYINTSKKRMYHFNNIVQIQNLSIGDIPIKYINADYPVNEDRDNGYQILNINDESTNIYSINTNSSIYSSHDSSINGYLRNYNDSEFKISMNIINEIVDGYSNPDHYVYEFGKTFVQVSEIAIISSEFPVSAYVITNTPESRKNNTIYWINQDDGNHIYSATLTSGSYTPEDLRTEIQNRMNEIIRTFSTSITHEIVITLDFSKNLVEFRSFSQENIPNPFKTFKYSKKIYINFDKHGLKDGDKIFITTAEFFSGIKSSYINKEHEIYFEDDNTIYIILQTSATDDADGVGGKKVTIRKLIQFRILWEHSDSFGDLLGFNNSKTPNFRTPQFMKVVSNESYNKYNYEDNKLLMNLAGDRYIFITNDIIHTIDNAAKIRNAFAKILLAAQSGSYVYNSFVSSPVIFEEPIPYLDKLEFKFVDYNGNVYNFNGLDHSFSLMIVENLETVDNIGISARTGSMVSSKY